jgi:hypothetical protein
MLSGSSIAQVNMQPKTDYEPWEHGVLFHLRNGKTIRIEEPKHVDKGT